MAQCLRVLLVEDSKVLTERLTEAIRQIPQVELIGTADTEATAVASAKRDSVDVIILDLHLKQGHARPRHRTVEAADHRVDKLRLA
jgi:chemotaxis response regulator CheB